LMGEVRWGWKNIRINPPPPAPPTEGGELTNLVRV
jgi:hypothetical protein